MIDFFFAVVAAGINGSGGDAVPPVAGAAPADVAVAEGAAQQAAPQSVVIGSNVQIGGGTVIEGAAGAASAAAAAPAVPAAAAPVAPAPTAAGPAGFVEAAVPAGLVAEPQVPSGKFTTATEVRPILNATRGNWIAVREYEGQDHLYITHLWSWRCGLAAIAISVNGEQMQNWPMPPCHMKYATPNAILPEDGAPHLRFRLGAVETVTVQVVYDDLGRDIAQFDRASVLIP